MFAVTLSNDFPSVQKDDTIAYIGHQPKAVRDDNNGTRSLYHCENFVFGFLSKILDLPHPRPRR